MFSFTELFSGWYLHRQEGGEAYKLVHGEVFALDLVTAMTGLWEHLFVVVWRVLWYFLVLPLRGRKESEPGLVSSTSWYNLQGCCSKGCKEKEGSFTSWGQLPVARWLHAEISSYICVLHLGGPNMKTIATCVDLPKPVCRMWKWICKDSSIVPQDIPIVKSKPGIVVKFNFLLKWHLMEFTFQVNMKYLFSYTLNFPRTFV